MDKDLEIISTRLSEIIFELSRKKGGMTTHLFDLVAEFKKACPDLETTALNYLADGIRWQFVDTRDNIAYEMVMKSKEA